MDLFTYLPPFNTTTFIKPMNEKEEEAPLEDPRVRRNHLAQERHIAQYEEQRVVDVSRRATQRLVRNDAQIATDANRLAAQRAVGSDAQITANASWQLAQRAVQRVVRSNVEIALENATRANARTFLHFDRQ
jgi:hypothetical protein